MEWAKFIFRWYAAMALDCVIDVIRVRGAGAGRPWTTLYAVSADRAYPPSWIREYLRSRGIRTVIPARRIRSVSGRTRAGLVGRPPRFDAEAYKGGNAVERACHQHDGRVQLGARYEWLAVV